MIVPAYDPFAGCKHIDNVTLPETWQRLHIIATAWVDIYKSQHRDYERALLDRSTWHTLEPLAKIEAKDWFNLCAAAGWTAYGAVALSWCEGVTLNQVWQGWDASGAILKPLDDFERPTRFLNPALLPNSDKISLIAKAFFEVYTDDRPSYQFCICCSLIAAGDSLEFDVSSEQLSRAEPQTAAFLKSRMIRKSNLSYI